MSERLVHKADFERLLSVRSRSRSTHFAVHHVAGRPEVPRKPKMARSADDLSTEPPQLSQTPVDNPPEGHWLACVVPKRHARRAVTRSLLKRQMRSVFDQHADALAPGLWLLRLSQSFAVTQFPSARSSALSAAVRQELEALLLRLSRQQPTAVVQTGLKGDRQADLRPDVSGGSA